MKDKIWKLLMITGLTVLADLITKEIVSHNIALFTHLDVIPGFFSITHVRNSGGAFGLFAGQATGLRTVFFLVMPVVALGVVLFMYAMTDRTKVWVNSALCLIAGGAVGNLIDRLRFGEVVDFLDFYIGTAHWPAFNVADGAISVGVGILFVQALTNKL